MSPSVIRGRELVDRHYDANGELTGWTVRDSGFTADDLTEIVADAVVKADTCPDCGQRLSRSTHVEMSGYYRVAYRGECQGCATWDEWRKEHKDEPNAHRYALVEDTEDGPAPDQADLDANPMDWSKVTPPAPQPTAVADSLAGPVSLEAALDDAFPDDTPSADVPHP